MRFSDCRRMLPWMRSPRNYVSWHPFGAGELTLLPDGRRPTMKPSSCLSRARAHGLPSNLVGCSISDLHEVCLYIAQPDSEAADRIGREILDHVRILTSFPFIGPTYPRGRAGRCARLSFVPTESFTMSPRAPAVLRFSTSGTAHGRNRSSEQSSARSHFAETGGWPRPSNTRN